MKSTPKTILTPGQSDPGEIVACNADGSSKPAASPAADEQIQFRPFDDDRLCKYVPLPKNPGYFGLCLNTAAEGQPAHARHMATTKHQEFAEMVCNAMQIFMVAQQMRAEKAEKEAAEQVAATDAAEAVNKEGAQ